MSELDPEKVGRSGVDPVTGSPLSQEVRTALLRKSTIDASVFQNIENRRAQTDAQNVELSRGQNEALLGFNSTLQAIRTDIVKLGTGLSGIALLLQQDATEDQSKVRVDQEKERRLAERQIRIGKENEIEQKIQNAVTEPVPEYTVWNARNLQLHQLTISRSIKSLNANNIKNASRCETAFVLPKHSISQFSVRICYDKFVSTS